MNNTTTRNTDSRQDVKQQHHVVVVLLLPAASPNRLKQKICQLLLLVIFSSFDTIDENTVSWMTELCIDFFVRLLLSLLMMMMITEKTVPTQRSCQVVLLQSRQVCVGNEIQQARTTRQ